MTKTRRRASKRTRKTKRQRRNYRGGSSIVYVPSVTIRRGRTVVLGVFEGEEDGIKALLRYIVKNIYDAYEEYDDIEIENEIENLYDAYKNDTSDNSTTVKLDRLFRSAGFEYANTDMNYGWYFTFNEFQTIPEEGRMPVMK